MPLHPTTSDAEPVIAVGLLDHVSSAAVQLQGRYTDQTGSPVPAGDLRVSCRDGVIRCAGACSGRHDVFELSPADPANCRFSVEATIGIDFHWQQRELQSFRGAVRIVARANDEIAVVNRVPLETYLASVVCSEMKATAPAEFIKAHAVISRSWLLAQLIAADAPSRPGPGPVTDAAALEESSHEAAGTARATAARGPTPDEPQHIRWTDREAHDAFDVCADDHCQRYQGVARIDAPGVATAVGQTRGEVLTLDARPCDTRFSKCCGGVIEEFATAWADQQVPYLVALRDTAGPDRQPPPLADDAAMRTFLRDPPPAYCNCTDRAILGRVLNDYDLATESFFRWQARLTAEDASRLVRRKLGVELGRLVGLEPLARGPSGRIVLLRLVGEQGTLVIGKELEIRRALSESHLYSSAFVVDLQGPPERPEAFVLTGAGWGHGVGLCQIGAAVMAHQGTGYREILQHYYPGTQIDQLYQ